MLRSVPSGAAAFDGSDPVSGLTKDGGRSMRGTESEIVRRLSRPAIGRPTRMVNNAQDGHFRSPKR